ncbi:acetyl-CoA hydrolase/transferase family protein [Fundicoccus culcitae]|uniref:4-hydroxybutyrate CoA-transferase n=1 Tax=Fundicoccus culcitae TaxID=2969821 RepID=A0ABY5P3Z1_9LACT|nr:acetyl-CoA hydrolase/transferase C-terminal domain-containing protein [Fundicoccus culcitae]UUX33426.1 4-hydroxybutyrate CoA-transferase [Fundicoccus culcitae]
MTNIQALYQEKLTTADEAVKLIQAKDTIVYPISPGEPPMLHEAIGRLDTLDHNTLFRMLPMSPSIDVPEEQLKTISIFLSGYDRKDFNERRIDLVPNHFSDIPSVILMRDENPIIMATVSPMDENGNFSLGTSVSYVGPLLKQAKHIILEVNENMPYTFGDLNHIHISDVSALVENNVELPAAPDPALNERDLAIGQIIADMVEDKDTLQIGFGSMPNAVMKFLTEKKEIGLHTEMFPDKAVELYEKGVITNQHKPFDEGKTVATFAYGSKEMYDFMNYNEDIYMKPCDVTNHFSVISQIDNLVAINSAVQVDFLGQCNSERVQDNYYSSTGGQSDFMKGVRLTKNGKGIICLYSTAKKDTISTIVPVLHPESPVTTSKNDIDTVVTEYGAAQLKGKTIFERTAALIKIAHPKFREELVEEAKKMNYLGQEATVDSL